MDSKYIKELVERYWLCKTTVDEENELKRFFSSADVPEELIIYKKWFAEISEDFIPVLDEAFDEKILGALPLKPESKHRKRIFIFRHWRQLAAILVVGLTTTIFIRHISTQDKQQYITNHLVEDTFDDPEEALAVLYKTLHFTIESIDKGCGMVVEDFRQADPALDIILTY